MRIEHKLSFMISDDSGQTDIIAERTERTETTDDYKHAQHMIVRIKGGTEVDIAPPDDCSFLYVRAPTAALVKVTAGGIENTYTMTPKGAASSSVEGLTNPAILFLVGAGTITGVAITNTGDQTVVTGYEVAMAGTKAITAGDSLT